MASIMAPRDSRPQLSSFEVVVGHMDGRWPGLESGGWQRVNQDSWIRAEPAVRARVAADSEPSGAGVAPREEPAKRDAAHAIWPDLP
jgi:hypothetical protein